MIRGQNYRGKERAKTSLKSLEASQRSTLTTSTRLASAGSSSLATTSWYDITKNMDSLQRSTRISFPLILEIWALLFSLARRGL